MDGLELNANCAAGGGRSAHDVGPQCTHLPAKHARVHLSFDRKQSSSMLEAAAAPRQARPKPKPF